MMNMNPYYVFVRNNTVWSVAKYYPKDGVYMLAGSEYDYSADDFDEIGEIVEMPG